MFNGAQSTYREAEKGRQSEDSGSAMNSAPAPATGTAAVAPAASAPPSRADEAAQIVADGRGIAPHADWSDSGDNSNSQDEDDFVPPAQGPSLSYERKIRLHKYAENRARSCLGLLTETSNVLWRLHDSKGDVGVYKPSSDWSEFVSAKAVTRANASFPNVLKAIYDLRTSDKFKLFMRKVLGDMFLDAEVLEDLNGTGIYPSANPPRDVREVYKQAAIKWWAIKSGTLASKSTDFYVLEVSRSVTFLRREQCMVRRSNMFVCGCSTLASKLQEERSSRATCFRNRLPRSAACRTSSQTTWNDRSLTR